MTKRGSTFALGLAFAYLSTAAGQQYPIMDMVANKIVQKYQQSSCEDLRQEKAHKKPPTQQEQKVIQMMRENPQMREHFINKVAAPIANKMFDCGMIP
jgi:hypothetical protein